MRSSVEDSGRYSLEAPPKHMNLKPIQRASWPNEYFDSIFALRSVFALALLRKVFGTE